jgi:Leucine-rich repeat (LRR) protein
MSAMLTVCEFAADDRSLKRRWIPADLVQNTAEYLGRVAGFLSFRGVSIMWQGAVSDAVGFLNGRCWTELSIHSPLLVALCLDDDAVVNRCALLCLGPRLETLEGRFPFPSGLLGEENNALTTLTLQHGTTDVRGLKNCRALKSLGFSCNNVTDADMRGLELIPALEDIRLPLFGSKVTDVSCLSYSRALKKLHLRYTSVTNAGIRGLELIPTLEDLDLRYTHVTDVSRLRDCRALKVLKLSNSNVTDAGIRGLELIPTLEDLNLARCEQLTDVSCLRDSRALKKLYLWRTGVTDAGIRGLELIPTLEHLTLECCWQVTDVSCMRNCRALKELDLSKSNVTDAGIRGLELIPTLVLLNLQSCSHVHDLSALRNRLSPRIITP